MRHFNYFGAALILAFVAACSGPKDTATGFITENREPPASANFERDNVPRDDYGRPYHYAFLGEPLPDFELTNTDGSAFTRADFIGSDWTVLKVWGIWCPDCIADGPSVQKLTERLGEEDNIRLLTVHTPPSRERAADAFGKYGDVETYFNANDYTYPYVVDTDAGFRETLEIPWTPSYLLVDPQGVVRGYRSDLSAAGDDAVEGFVADIKTVMAK